MIPTLAELKALGRDAGLCAVGVTTADPFPDTRRDLERRKEAGLDGGMQFTYRNPARSTDPARTMPGATALVVGAYDYRRTVPPPPEHEPVGRVAAYSWDDHYAVLRAALDRLAAPLREAGHRAMVLADENNLVDRAVAHRAGLGWWGKSSNLLVPGVGSLVVLGSVLTDAPLVIEPAPEVDDGCGACTKCLDECPTGAIIGPGVVDGRRCLAWLLQAEGPFPVEYRVALGDRLYGCDDCQDVCPPNMIRLRRPGRPGAPGAWVPVLDLLELDDDALMARYGRWYVPRRDPDYLRRNALVVLGNVGTAADDRTVRVLTAMLDHPTPMVRAHAVWAARQLGHVRLLAGVARDAPEVVAELDR